VTADQHDTDAAGRLRAYLEARTHGRDASITWDDLRDVLRQLDDARTEIDRLTREITDLRPYADAGRHAAEEAAKREYYTGTCEDCSCCTNAQCREGRCPENSIGESTCPCTCE
jgi:hypothetical protein